MRGREARLLADSNLAVVSELGSIARGLESRVHLQSALELPHHVIATKFTPNMSFRPSPRVEKSPNELLQDKG